MNGNCVVKLNQTGPRGEEVFLAVDFTTREASVIFVAPQNGNLIVTDVQAINVRGDRSAR
jgi:hypothetical protein